MKVTVSEPKKSQVTLTIEVESSDLDKFMDKAVAELGQKVSVKGFRKGRIPHDVLEQQLGAGAIRAHALDLALPYLYADAIIQNKVQAVARPTIKWVSEDPVVFEATVAVLPEVKIKGHDKIKIPTEEVSVKEEDMEELIHYMLMRDAKTSEVDRAAQKGDRVEMEFEGFDPDGDVPLEGTASKNHPVVLGEGSLIPGFEDEVAGMKAGEEKTFELTFPKDYHSDKFKNKRVKFKVKVNQVQEVKLPELNSEWIEASSGQKRTVEEFRKDLKDSLEKERDIQIKKNRENKFLEELTALVEADIPDAMIEEEIDFILDRTKMDLEEKGLKWEQYVKFLEDQKRDPRAEKRDQAEKQIKLRLGLNHLYKIEEITATETEVAEKLEEMMLAYPPAQHASIRAAYKPGTEGYRQIENTLLLQKLLTRFLSN